MIEQNLNVKACRQAVAMLAHHRAADPHVLPVFRQIASNDGDRKLRRHAEQGLERYATAGLDT